MTNLSKEELNLLGKLLANFGATNNNPPDQTVEKLYKRFYPDDMYTVEPIYVAGDEVDAHGDGYDDPVEGPKKLVKALEEGQKKNTLQYSLVHKYLNNTFEIVKMWVTEETKTLEDGTKLPANLPVALVKWKNESAYNARVNGRLTGLSIGAMGVVEATVHKNFLEEFKVAKRKSRVIKDFIFTHKAAHIAFTTPSQGGAASLHNEYYDPEILMKAKVMPDKEQEALLEEFGELAELRELAKAKKEAESLDKETPSTSVDAEAQDAGVDTVNEIGQSQMSEDLQKKVEELEKRLANVLAATELEKSLKKYALEEATASSLAQALVSVTAESKEVILKSFDAILAVKDAEVAEVKSALESVKVEKETLEKSMVKVEVNPLLKALSGEVGEAAPEKQEAPKTLAERISAKLKA